MALATIIQPPFRVTLISELVTYLSTFTEGSLIFCDEDTNFYQKLNGVISVVITPIIASIAINEEIPTGTINGTNATFTLVHIPKIGSLKMIINGLMLKLTDDFTVTGNTVTMIQIPWTGCNFLANYNY